MKRVPASTAHQGRLKILLSEGSSTSARQTLYALGRLGHTVDICDPQRLGLGRFSRYVRRWYRCPSFTAEPGQYLRFLAARLRRERYDVLFPVHDQVYLLSRFRQSLARRVGLALPDFESLEQVQSKVAFLRLLDVLGLPHPRATVVRDPSQLEGRWDYPCYVKLAYSTAGCGVWLVRDLGQMRRVAGMLQSAERNLYGSEILVQQPGHGTFCVAQSVFQHGRLVAAHFYRSRATGVGGSAHARESTSHPVVREHLERLGGHLNWHGALHLEYFCDAAGGRISYIEANPRIGETFNAMLSGTNLCELLVQVSLERPIEPPAASQPGVRTHSVLTSLMGGAQRGGGRRTLVAELWRAWTHQGIYQNSQDELTRPREDPWSLLPATAVALQLLVRPGAVHRIIRRAVDNYALDDAAVRHTCQVPADLLVWQDDPGCSSVGED